MLASLGYVKGQGLGRDGRGLAEPVDVTARPRNVGLGYAGLDGKRVAARRLENLEKERRIEECTAKQRRGDTLADKKRTERTAPGDTKGHLQMQNEVTKRKDEDWRKGWCVIGHLSWSL